jgi:ribose transport system permease protein
VQHDLVKAAEPGHAAISDVAENKEQTFAARIFASQPFWVTIALAMLVVVMAINEPSFGTVENAANVTRNFAPIGIMAMGMTVVIITGGIDLSVGSVMGLVAIVAGLFLTWHYPWYVAFAMGMLAGIACGMVNGFFVAYVGMPSFVVTLGMLSIARSLAVVFSANQMLYQFGPDAPIVKAIGQAKWPLRAPAGWPGPHGWLRVQFQSLGSPSLCDRWQRAGCPAHRCSGRLDQISGLCVFRIHRVVSLASAARLQRLGHQCHGAGL